MAEWFGCLIPFWEESNWSTEEGEEFLVFAVISRNLWPFLTIVSNSSHIPSQVHLHLFPHPTLCLGRRLVWIIPTSSFAFCLPIGLTQKEALIQSEGVWRVRSEIFDTWIPPCETASGWLCPMSKITALIFFLSFIFPFQSGYLLFLLLAWLHWLKSPVQCFCYFLFSALFFYWRVVDLQCCHCTFEGLLVYLASSLCPFSPLGLWVVPAFLILPALSYYPTSWGFLTLQPIRV